MHVSVAPGIRHQTQRMQTWNNKCCFYFMSLTKWWWIAVQVGNIFFHIAITMCKICGEWYGHWYVYTRNFLKLSQLENYQTLEPACIIISHQFFVFSHSLFWVLLHLDSMQKYVNQRLPFLILGKSLTGGVYAIANAAYPNSTFCAWLWCSYTERNNVKWQRPVHIAI